jgi:periplasmic divalent cation tolerance protein
MAEHVQAFTVVESEADAVALARSAVENRLAADAQIIGPVRTLRLWRDEALEEIREWQVVMRTTTERFSALKEHISKDHAEDEPQIIATPIVEGSAAYLAWVSDQVG